MTTRPLLALSIAAKKTPFTTRSGLHLDLSRGWGFVLWGALRLVSRSDTLISVDRRVQCSAVHAGCAACIDPYAHRSKYLHCESWHKEVSRIRHTAMGENDTTFYIYRTYIELIEYRIYIEPL